MLDLRDYDDYFVFFFIEITLIRKYTEKLVSLYYFTHFS